MSRPDLDVWLHGTRVAVVSEDRTDRISLRWTPEATERWSRGVRVLSATLTVGDRPVPPLVRAYLDGLLPEGNARVNHALSAGVAPDDTLGLVAAYGRDTPGAAIIVPAGSPDPTRSGTYRPLEDAEVAERLRRADAHQPSSPTRATESSTLPGMVPKITLHRDAGRWFACTDGAPSTWILKRAAEASTEVADVVDTEVAALAVARAIGLTSIDAEIVDFGDVRAIAVSRYDRGPDGARLHQEDLAQALGLSTQDPNRKFQWGSRLPSLRHAADVLRLDGGKPDRLLAQVTLSFLLGNTDLHAKNLSFLRHDDGRVALAPAYDVAMHLHHPRPQRRFALDLHGRHLLDDLTTLDVVEEGVSWGLPHRRALRVVQQTATSTAVAWAELDRTRHPGVTTRAWDTVSARLEEAVGSLGSPDGRPTVPEPRAATTRRGPRPPR